LLKSKNGLFLKKCHPPVFGNFNSEEDQHFQVLLDNFKKHAINAINHLPGRYVFQTPNGLKYSFTLDPILKSTSGIEVELAGSWVSLPNPGFFSPAVAYHNNNQRSIDIFYEPVFR